MNCHLVLSLACYLSPRYRIYFSPLRIDNLIQLLHIFLYHFILILYSIQNQLYSYAKLANLLDEIPFLSNYFVYHSSTNQKSYCYYYLKQISLHHYPVDKKNTPNIYPEYHNPKLPYSRHLISSAALAPKTSLMHRMSTKYGYRLIDEQYAFHSPLCGKAF